MPTAPVPQKKLRFGVMCNEDRLQVWQKECVQELLNSGCADLVLVVEKKTTAEKTGFWKKWKNYPYRHLWYRIYRRFVFRPPSTQMVSMQGQMNEATERMHCEVERKGHANYFHPQDLKKIKSHNLDFILRFGFDIIRGEILTVPKYGIWSFHHGNQKEFRGGPPGFWEIFKKEAVTGSVLQQLTDTLDAGLVLKKGQFLTQFHSWSAHLNQLLSSTTRWPLQVCKDILNGQAHCFNKQTEKSKAKIYKSPTNYQMLLFCLKRWRSWLSFHIKELLFFEYWGIGFVHSNIESILEKEMDDTVAWMDNPNPNTYWADPFAFMDDGKTVVLAEEYDYKNPTGKITSVVGGESKVALQPPYHLAYPYAFSHEGTAYCIPESANIGKAGLYVWNSEKKQFLFKKWLLEDFAAVDPTLFQYENRWWLFCTHKNASNTDLYAFYAQDLNTPFTAHANNPIKQDITSARPGGTPFYANGKLFRPVQNGAPAYGSQVGIFEIQELTPLAFEEKWVKWINPIRNSPHPAGIHTLSKVGDKVLIDGKSMRFIFPAFVSQCQRKFRRLVGKATI